MPPGLEPHKLVAGRPLEETSGRPAQPLRRMSLLAGRSYLPQPAPSGGTMAAMPLPAFARDWKQPADVGLSSEG